ncbi:MAG TPA: TspO/MBR family protein [Xanthomonadales bacterium]|nr:TspO/MBR family protein [Xanthomonadales bacterium]
MNNTISLAFFLLAVFAAAVLGAGYEAGSWYQTLSKPPWAPPDWLYGPVWAVVYVLMAVAAWTVWNSGRSVRIGAITWWLILLLLIFCWSWIFFGLNRTGWAVGLAIVLFGLSIMCCRAFFLVSRSAGVMLLPLTGWLMFFAYLNYAFWTMNAGGFGTIFG